MNWPGRDVLNNVNWLRWATSSMLMNKTPRSSRMGLLVRLPCWRWECHLPKSPFVSRKRKEATETQIRLHHSLGMNKAFFFVFPWVHGGSVLRPYKIVGVSSQSHHGSFHDVSIATDLPNLLLGPPSKQSSHALLFSDCVPYGTCPRYRLLAFPLRYTCLRFSLHTASS